MALVSLLCPFLISSSPLDLKKHLYTDESKIVIVGPDISSSASVSFVPPFMWMVTVSVTWAKKDFKFSLKTISLPVLCILVNQTTVYPVGHTLSWSFFFFFPASLHISSIFFFLYRLVCRLAPESPSPSTPRCILLLITVVDSQKREAETSESQL